MFVQTKSSIQTNDCDPKSQNPNFNFQFPSTQKVSNISGTKINWTGKRFFIYKVIRQRTKRDTRKKRGKSDLSPGRQIVLGGAGFATWWSPCCCCCCCHCNIQGFSCRYLLQYHHSSSSRLFTTGPKCLLPCLLLTFRRCCCCCSCIAVSVSITGCLWWCRYPKFQISAKQNPARKQKERKKQPSKTTKIKEEEEQQIDLMGTKPAMIDWLIAKDETTCLWTQSS